MAEEAGERTEAPTAKRKQKAVDDGDVLKSREFATALVMLAGVGWLVFVGPALVRGCAAVMAASFRFDRGDVEDFAPWRPLVEAGGQLAWPLLSLFAIVVAAAIASQAALGSFGFNAKLMAPKASRIDPAAGLKRILGAGGWIELAKSLFKIALLGAIGVWMLWRSSRMTMGLAQTDIGSAVDAVGGTFKSVLIVMALGLVGIAGLDVPVQIVRRLAKMRMTKQEIRDEHKESEGSPEVKAQRHRARAMLSKSARKAVAEAQVVLTNPTHFAVALRYDRGRDQVPVVVAKGRGATALAIRELAAETATPVLEYPALARAVYYTSREGQEVRDDLYMAIATVLAFVFGLNERVGGSPPPVEVPITARFDENGVKPAV